MAKKHKFRLAVAASNYPSKERPPKPKWLSGESRECKKKYKYSQRHSWQYWTRIYWATPPWLSIDMVRELKRLYEECLPTHQVDHIVPLNSPLVCGLHVPWNLQYLTTESNQAKSNDMWPDHPNEPMQLF